LPGDVKPPDIDTPPKTNTRYGGNITLAGRFVQAAGQFNQATLSSGNGQVQVVQRGRPACLSQQVVLFAKLTRALGPLHGNQATTWGEKGLGQDNQFTKRTKSSGGHQIETRPIIPVIGQLFDTFMKRRKTVQTKGSYDMALKINLFTNSINGDNVKLGTDNFQGQRGETGTGPDIEQTGRLPGKREQGQGIDQVLLQHLITVSDCSQVPARIPAQQLVDQPT
jgi:hypothetical protein